MSITFNGSSQYAYRATAPTPSDFVAAGWFRRTSDSGTAEVLFSLDSGSSANETLLYIDSSDQLLVYSNGAVSGNLTANVAPIVTNTWYWVMIRHTGGTLSVRHVADGGSAWASNSTSATSALTFSAVTVGARYGTGTASAFAPSTCALVKLWSGTLPTDAEVLAERLSRDVTVTAGRWGQYKFANGALATDDSGNSRTLTLAGTPTYTADAPTDLAAAGAGPTITTQPVATTVVRNDATRASRTFTVAATGTGSLTYAWQVSSGGAYSAVSNGGIYAGATTATLTITPTANTQNGYTYRAVVTDSNGSTTTSAATLTVRTGVVLSAAGGTTNGSGVAAFTATSDIAQAAGEVIVVRATDGTLVERTTLRFA